MDYYGLVNDIYEDFVKLDKTSANDALGGMTTVWKKGAIFQANASLNTTMEARSAQQVGVTAVYTINTKRNIILQPLDVVERISDGKIFRVKSDGDDKATPPSAGLDMRVVNAEEWKLPNE